VDVGAADFELFGVADAVVGKASLPDGELGGEAVGEASLDESDGAFEGFVRGEEEMDVVGHDDEGVEFVVAFPPQPASWPGTPIRLGSAGGSR